MMHRLALALIAFAPLHAAAQNSDSPPPRGWLFKAQREPRLYYQDTLDERPVFIALIEFSCTPSNLSLEVVGLTAAQAFPQPMMTVSINELEREGYPTGIFHPESFPQSVGSGIMLQSGNRPLWPGTPEYASFEMPALRPPYQLLEALREGGVVTISFNGQMRRYEPIPAELGAQFADACLKSPLLRQAR